MGVEAATNGTGLDLLRIAVSRFAQRTEATRAAHLGLTLVACGQTAQKLRESGCDVRLLPATSALDQIVLRMQQGWAYVRNSPPYAGTGLRRPRWPARAV